MKPAGKVRVELPLVLALDMGTSSLRTALFHANGTRIVESTAQIAYRLKYTPDGGAELSPNVLRRAAKIALRRTLRFYGERAELRKLPIAAVGASCFWHSLVGVNRAGHPLTPVYTWADSRCREDALRLRQELDERAVHARTGCMLRASFWPAKLRWLHRTQRKVAGQVQRWMSPVEWLQFDLAGDAHCGLAMASGTGLLDAARLTWDPQMLDLCGLTAERMNVLSEEPFSPGRSLPEFPELNGVPWYPALGDGVASNLGCGATHAGLAAINVGTSAALRVMRTHGKPRAPLGLFCYRADHDRFLVGGAISNAGNLRAWCLRELRLMEDPVRLELALAKRPVPRHGLTVLPFWTAERSPSWDEDKSGVLAGITQNTTALDILQATTEASYQRLAMICELVLKTEPHPPKFIVSGGIQKSRSSVQRLANVMNHELFTNDEPEASVRGGAVYVLQRLGFQVPAYRFSHPIRPKPEHAEIYAVERERARRLESSL